MNVPLNDSTIDIRYGLSNLQIRLPSQATATVIRKRPMRKLPDAAAAVRDALANPIGRTRYAEIVRGRKSACILICDITRPVPNRAVPAAADRGHAGRRHGRANGSPCWWPPACTGPNEGAELAEVVGDPWVLETVRVENHFARDDATRTSTWA